VVSNADGDHSRDFDGRGRPGRKLRGLDHRAPRLETQEARSDTALGARLSNGCMACFDASRPTKWDVVMTFPKEARPVPRQAAVEKKERKFGLARRADHQPGDRHRAARQQWVETGRGRDAGKQTLTESLCWPASDDVRRPGHRIGVAPPLVVVAVRPTTDDLRQRVPAPARVVREQRLPDRYRRQQAAPHRLGRDGARRRALRELVRLRVLAVLRRRRGPRRSA
jgi:hypothetical protein